VRIEPHHLDGMAALTAAESTPLRKQKGERDTEFVKRIVCAYMNASMLIAGMEVLAAHADHRSQKQEQT